MPATRLRSWTLVTAGLAGGLAAGLLLAPFVATNAAVPIPQAVRVATTSTEATPCPQWSFAMISAEVRRVTREELAAFEQSLGRTHEPLADPRNVDPMQVAALARAHTILDRAIGRRQWTDADADSLRAEMAGLPASQRTEIVRQLSLAINQGQVTPESDRLPF